MKKIFFLFIIIPFLYSCHNKFEPEELAEDYLDDMLECATNIGDLKNSYDKADAISQKLIRKLNGDNNYDFDELQRFYVALFSLAQTPKYELAYSFMDLADFHRYNPNITTAFEYIKMGEEIVNGGTVFTYQIKKKEAFNRKWEESQEQFEQKFKGVIVDSAKFKKFIELSEQ